MNVKQDNDLRITAHMSVMGQLQCEILLQGVALSLVSQTQIQRLTAAPLIWLHFQLSSLTATPSAFLTV